MPRKQAGEGRSRGERFVGVLLVGAGLLLLVLCAIPLEDPPPLVFFLPIGIALVLLGSTFFMSVWSGAFGLFLLAIGVLVGATGIAILVAPDVLGAYERTGRMSTPGSRRFAGGVLTLMGLITTFGGAAIRKAFSRAEEESDTA